jgi:hypothetical protein
MQLRQETAGLKARGLPIISTFLRQRTPLDDGVIMGILSQHWV